MTAPANPKRQMSKIPNKLQICPLFGVWRFGVWNFL